jgi:hypothetical protein
MPATFNFEQVPLPLPKPSLQKLQFLTQDKSGEKHTHTYPYSKLSLFLGGCGDLQKLLQNSHGKKIETAFVYINAS